MIFRWLRNRRRKRIRNAPFPEEWLHYIDQNLAFFAYLNESERSKLCSDVQVFVAEKNWEGCGGLTLTDEIRVTIAAQACLLVLSFENELFDRVETILVYPDAYVAPSQTITKGGLVLEGESPREGEAWYRGPVILSWADALAGGRGETDGDNLVLHEFAHQLDMQNGRELDGTPPLPTPQHYREWQRIMGKTFDELVHDCRLGLPTVLDCYGTTNLAELFAVATECFFERPGALASRNPELYELLSQFYRQDPATRLGESYGHW